MARSMFWCRPLAICVFIYQLTKVTNGQVNFASIGNWGSGGSTQKAVASQLKHKAKQHSMSFVISPGSNFNDGVESLNDTRWEKLFENVYEGPDLNLPFFTVLGEDDWKANHTAQALRTNIQYGEGTEEGSKLIPRWTLPNWWYHYSLHFSDSTETSAAYGSTGASVGFVFIDTNILSEQFPFKDITKMHWDGLRDTIGAAVRIFDWVIVVGDKAMLSSGASKGDSYLSQTLRQLLKDNQVDAYISGSDYDMEVIEDGSLLHINCGTGSSADALARVKADNSVFYASKAGFCQHRLTKKAFQTEFIDGHSGEQLGIYTKKRNVRDRFVLDRFQRFKELPKVVYVPVPDIEALPTGKNDLFVRVCGSIGLISAGFVLVIYLTTLFRKIYKSGRRD